MKGKIRAFSNWAGGGALCLSLLILGAFLPPPASAIEGVCVSAWCPVHGQVSCNHTHYSAPQIDYEAIRRAQEEQRRLEELRRIENQKNQLRGEINSIKDGSYSVAAQRKSQIEDLEADLRKLKTALEAQRKKLEGKVSSGQLSLGIYGRSSQFSGLRSPVMPLSGGLEDLNVAELEDYKKEVQNYVSDLESYYGTGIGELSRWLAADKQRLIELEHLEASLKLRKSAHSAETAGFNQIRASGTGEAAVELRKISSAESDVESREKKLQERISKMGDPVLPRTRPSPPGPGATRQEREEYKRKMDEYLRDKAAYEKELTATGKERRELDKLKKGSAGEEKGDSGSGDVEARRRQLAQELVNLKAPAVPVIKNTNDPADQQKLQEYRTQQAAYDQKVKGMQEELKGLDDQKLQAQKSQYRKAAGLPEPPAENVRAGASGQSQASAGSSQGAREGPASTAQTQPSSQGKTGKINLPNAQELFDKVGLPTGGAPSSRGPLDHVKNEEGLGEEAREGFDKRPQQGSLPKVLPGKGLIEAPPDVGAASVKP